MRGEPAPATGTSRAASRIWLEDLLSFFPANRKILDGMEIVPDDSVPEPYRRLLVHEEHMTVTLEAFHGAPVHLKVRAVNHRGDDYARKLVLTAGDDGSVVLAGFMRFRLHFCEEKVRREIIAAEKPLGRILIEHGVLRRIQFHDCLKADLKHGLGEIFGAPDDSRYTYGRLAMIFCDEQPAVELLEIVAPTDTR